MGRKSDKALVVGAGRAPPLAASGGAVGPRQLPRGPPFVPARLGVLIPEAQLLQGHVEVEAVVLLAAADATLVGRWAVAAVAVLEHAGVPGQAQTVAADAGLPAVPHLPTARQQHLLRGPGESLEHGAIHTWEKRRGSGRGRGPPCMAPSGIPVPPGAKCHPCFTDEKTGPERLPAWLTSHGKQGFRTV